MRKLLEITTGRHPFQVATVTASPLAALAVLISGKFPPSLDAALPGPFAEVWLGGLALSGIVTHVGVYWRGDLDTGLLVEGGGLSLMASMLTIYASALLLVQGGTGFAAAAFLGSIAVAGWWRAVQVGLDVRKVWRAQREGVTARVRVLADPDHPDTPPGPGAR